MLQMGHNVKRKKTFGKLLPADWFLDDSIDIGLIGSNWLRFERPGKSLGSESRVRIWCQSLGLSLICVLISFTYTGVTDLFGTRVLSTTIFNCLIHLIAPH